LSVCIFFVKNNTSNETYIVPVGSEICIRYKFRVHVSELLARLARGEDLQTDFKDVLGPPRELAKDLVCFANSNGGQIIFGVTKDQRIVGVEDPSALCDKVDEVAFQQCGPPSRSCQRFLR